MDFSTFHVKWTSSIYRCFYAGWEPLEVQLYFLIPPCTWSGNLSALMEGVAVIFDNLFQLKLSSKSYYWLLIPFFWLVDKPGEKVSGNSWRGALLDRYGSMWCKGCPPGIFETCVYWPVFVNLFVLFIYNRKGNVTLITVR